MKFTIAISLAGLILFSSCKKDTVMSSSGRVTLSLTNSVAGQSFSLNKEYTIGGKTYNFTAFRYWVSNVVLTSTGGQQFAVPHAYYLVEQTNSQSVQDGSFVYPATARTSIELQGVPLGTYRSITFSIGVDKTHNDNLSLQDGELNQLNNMTNVTWMWHTSYIFSNLEGKVSDGSSNKLLKVQTGLNDNFISMSYDLGSSIGVASNGNASISFNVDVAKVIDGIDTWGTPEVSASTPAVMQAVALNYKTKVFSFQSAK